MNDMIFIMSLPHKYNRQKYFHLKNSVVVSLPICMLINFFPVKERKTTYNIQKAFSSIMLLYQEAGITTKVEIEKKMKKRRRRRRRSDCVNCAILISPTKTLKWDSCLPVKPSYK